MNDKAELVLAAERFERAREEYDAAAELLRDLVRRGLRHAQQQVRTTPVRIESDDTKQIIACVAAHHGIPVPVLMGRARTARIAVARQQAMAIARELLQMPYEELGKVFKRDHGTIMWAMNSVSDRRITEPRYSADYDLLLAKCRAEISAAA